MAVWLGSGSDRFGSPLGRAARWVWADAFRRRLTGSALALLLAAAALWFVPTPYYVTAPGAAFAVHKLVLVPGAVRPDHPGELLLLTVATQRANLWWWLYAQADPKRATLQTPREYLGYYPDYEEYYRDTVRMMEDSRRFAAAAGLRALGYHVPVRTDSVYVSAVPADAPARGVLRGGDTILAWAGQAAPTVDEIVTQLAAHPPGTPVKVRVRRGKEELELEVPTARARQREGATTGALVTARYVADLPVAVQIRPGIITGPSAGLAFSLEVIAQLSQDDVLGGRTVAATGEVDWLGNVGPIGGARQKVFTAEAAGADVMFVPQGNHDEAAPVATRVLVVPVRTVNDALDWLRSHPPGKES